MAQNKNNRKYKLTAPNSTFMKELNKDGRITCWKVYGRETNPNSLYSVVYTNIVDDPGLVKSSRTSKKLSGDEKYKWKIEPGIHVYTSRRKAQSNQYSRHVVVPVTCYKKDLVAQGTYNEAVFMEVTIEPRTWNKIFSKKKG